MKMMFYTLEISNLPKIFHPIERVFLNPLINHSLLLSMSDDPEEKIFTRKVATDVSEDWL